jgi:TRAP-type C4-dicarboxylate transport system permease small subunit
MSIGRSMYRILDLVRKYVTIFCLGFVVLACFVDVIFRYFPWLKSLGWVEEITRCLNVWIILFGASVGVTRRSHLSVDFFLRLFSAKIQERITKAVYVTILAFLAIFVVFGTLKTFENIPQLVQSFPISIAWFYLAIPVASFFMFIDFLLILIYGHHPFYKTKEEK